MLKKLREQIFAITKRVIKNVSVNPIYYILLLGGMALRIVPYILNRSLWLDEAKLAVNIADRSFSELLHPLDYGQMAPVLFLFIEKANIIIFGNSEYSLRLLPLLCGLMSLPLIYRFTRAVTGSNAAALLALFIQSISIDLIYYSGEVKQYECDVFVTLVLLNIVFDKSLFSNDRKRYLLLAILGSVFIFLSNITVLVLFIIGIYYLFKYGLKFIFKNRLIIVMFVCWVISFAVYYLCFAYNNSNMPYQDHAWGGDFMPLQIFSSQFVSWIYLKFLSVFELYVTPISYSTTGNNDFNYSELMFAIVYIVAMVFFIIKRKWTYLFLLLFPLALHFAISGLQLYPVYKRFLLYLTAFITPMLSIAIVELIELMRIRLIKYVAYIAVSGLLALMVISLWQNTYIWHEEEIKKSIDFINDNRWPGQPVYVYYSAQFATKYYVSNNYISFGNDIVWGASHRRDPRYYIYDILKLNGEVWLLFTHDISYIDNEQYLTEQDYILKQLQYSNMVYPLKAFQTKGSSAYLVKIVHH